MLFVLAASLLFTGCSDFLIQRTTLTLQETTSTCRKKTARQQPLLYIVRYGSTSTINSITEWETVADIICAPPTRLYLPVHRFERKRSDQSAGTSMGITLHCSSTSKQSYQRYKGGMSESVKPQYIAEARFMRGVAYYYLGMLWGNVILNENSDELVANPIVAPSPASDVFEFVMRDLEYAAKYLPETSYATGRVNQYSAFAMLSRVYLTYAGYSDNKNSGTRNSEYLELAKKSCSESNRE